MHRSSRLKAGSEVCRKLRGTTAGPGPSLKDNPEPACTHAPLLLIFIFRYVSLDELHIFLAGETLGLGVFDVLIDDRSHGLQPSLFFFIGEFDEFVAFGEGVFPAFKVAFVPGFAFFYDPFLVDLLRWSAARPWEGSSICPCS